MTAYTLKLVKPGGIYSVWKFIKLLIIKVYSLTKLLKYSYMENMMQVMWLLIRSVQWIFFLFFYSFLFKEVHWLNCEANQRISKLGECEGSWKVASIEVFMICKLFLLVGTVIKQTLSKIRHFILTYSLCFVKYSFLYYFYKIF